MTGMLWSEAKKAERDEEGLKCINQLYYDMLKKMFKRADGNAIHIAFCYLLGDPRKC
jgi:predicted metal-binding protein